MRRARPLLGTFVEVTVAGLDESEAHRAADAAFAVIGEVQRRMSFHDPASMISELNRSAFRRPVEVDEWMFAVLEAAREMWRVSDGTFDITIAPRLQALGFLPSGARGGARPRSSTFADVHLLPGRRVRFGNPDTRLDLGGIAKGFAVDRAIDALRECGVESALVNAGGDLRAVGGQAFPVSIRNPHAPGAALTNIALSNAAIASSAHHFAGRLVPGATLGPILDPRTGSPARTVQTATVRARSAMVADALTKVVMLRGEAALSALDHFDADALFLATEGGILCSPRWHEAFHLST